MWNNTPRRLTAQDRLSICRGCPYVRQTYGVGLTCGTLLKPEYNIHGEKITCGCVLGLKVEFPNEHCPQEKW
jgi:hypothetical protein